MTCNVESDVLARYAAGELAPSRSDRIAAHVKKCPECALRLESLRTVDLALDGLARVEPPAAAIHRVRRALGDEIRGRKDPEIMTMDEVAAFLRVSPAAMAQVMADLPVFEIGGELRARRTRVIEWIEECEQSHVQSRTASAVARMRVNEVEVA